MARKRCFSAGRCEVVMYHQDLLETWRVRILKTLNISHVFLYSVNYYRFSKEMACTNTG